MEGYGPAAGGALVADDEVSGRQGVDEPTSGALFQPAPLADVLEGGTRVVEDVADDQELTGVEPQGGGVGLEVCIDPGLDDEEEVKKLVQRGDGDFHGGIITP